MDIKEELSIYRQVIQFLDESTEAYLYLYDLVNGKIYFTDKISERYNLPLSGDQGISVKEWQSIVYFKDRKRLEDNLGRIQKGYSDNHNIEYRLVNKHGDRIWINCRGNVKRDKEGTPRILIGNVSELPPGRTVDPLTGLWNHERFMEDVAERLDDQNGYLMILGIDNFKNINVKNGRTFGNQVLKYTTDILEKYAEYPVKLYRLMGDCFAVNFLQNDKEAVVRFYEQVKKDLEQYCTLSAGVVSYEENHITDGSMAYQYAENALYRAKKEGKNMLIFFSLEDFQEEVNKIRQQDELRESVKNGCEGFSVYYQPQVYGKDFSLYGAEALVRFCSPTRGLVGPAEFIPMLEQSGLICTVGLWVLREAIRQCVKWREVIPDFHVNVNISYVQLQQERIIEDVLNLLREYDLPGEALTLEVTESMQLQDYAYFNKIFYEWKKWGIQIAIDDFGTGYSNLSYLKSMDIDETKIDRCFVSRVCKNVYNYRLIRNMIELSHSARMKVCCEGVETEEELAALRELNPDVLQGYLFAKPCDKETFEKLYLHPEEPEYEKRRKIEAKLKSIRSLEERKFLINLNYEDILRQKDFYGALLSETEAYVEVDVDHDKILLSGGLWKEYCQGESFEKVFQQYVKSVTWEEDLESYKSFMDLEVLREMYNQGITTKECSIRRYVDGYLCWMKLTLHIFQERYTGNMYALLYLKNIDEEQRKFLAQEKAAKEDPLTELYNRKAFRDEVLCFMDKPDAQGTFIILDVDNFKQINDQYGHLKGDEVLKYLSETLRHTFRNQDVLARIGGDEFIVFVKNVTDRKILESRMRELFDKLRNKKDISLACSAGIVSLKDSSKFVYRDTLYKADQALYRSKEKGKNQYSYFDPE